MATYLELKGDTFISRDAEEWRAEQMKKSLGQIAFEAHGVPSDWRFADVDRWEAAAQAVRAAVIEECEKVCDSHATNHNAKFCASAIRALKDKQ